MHREYAKRTVHNLARHPHGGRMSRLLRCQPDRGPELCGGPLAPWRWGGCLEARESLTGSPGDLQRHFRTRRRAHAEEHYSAHEAADETRDHAAAALNPEAALRRRTMTARRTHLPVLFLVLTLLGCDRPDAAGVAAPSFTVGGVGRPSVLVNPNANDQGTAKTIQEGIDMVGEGGTVRVLPGTYAEAIVIDKGLTLESVEGESGSVVVEPPGAPTTAVAITTPAPVVIRGLTVHATGVNGIRGAGVVDVTVERVSVTAVNPPPGVHRLVSRRH